MSFRPIKNIISLCGSLHCSKFIGLLTDKRGYFHSVNRNGEYTSFNTLPIKNDVIITQYK